MEGLGDYDPYAVILQLTHDVEQLGYQLESAGAVIANQGDFIVKISQHLQNLALGMEMLDKRLSQLEDEK
mgnify:CR=1 FL=1